jgi:hypothetical protein
MQADQPGKSIADASSIMYHSAIFVSAKMQKYDEQVRRYSVFSYMIHF